MISSKWLDNNNARATAKQEKVDTSACDYMLPVAISTASCVMTSVSLEELWPGFVSDIACSGTLT